MEKPKKSALRRPETTTTTTAMDVKKMSSSLNMSTSSLRSSSGDVDRRTAATVRFAPTPTTLTSSSSSSSSAARRAGSSRVVSSSSKQAGVGAARPATARPASAGRRRLHGASPELGLKGLRRSWGWGTGDGGGGGDGEEKESGGHLRPGDADVAAVGEVKAPVRSSSVPRRITADQEKQHPKRESKTKITSNSKTKASSGSPPKAEDDSMDRRIPNTAARKTNQKASSNVSLNNMVRQSPPRKTTPTIGASWESLSSDLQSIGLEVMSYRDAAEVAAVEALQEASSAEILLRCLSAFADLAAIAAEQSPQQTVDEFLALQAMLAHSAAAAGDYLHAEDWLRAAVSGDLGRFSLYSAAVSPSRTAQPAMSAAEEEEPTAEAGRTTTTTWLAAAAREVGEETRGWFLGHVERLIDADAAGTLGQLKRVNDWLEEEAPSSEAAERLRKKIFRYLLDHVESAVVALNGAAAAHGRRK